MSVTRYSQESSILEYHLHILELEAEELQCLRQAHVMDYYSHLQSTHKHNVVCVLKEYNNNVSGQMADIICSLGMWCTYNVSANHALHL